MHSLIRNMKKREGFTLIELMIVVAIIGILAAIAIPNFIKFQLRSKAGEGKIALAGIRTAEESYFAEAGTYPDWAVWPVAVPGQQKIAFAPACPAPGVPLTPGTDPGYCFIGWQPEGDVYFMYEVTANNPHLPNPAPLANSFGGFATSDIDGDLTQSNWGINAPDVSGVYTAVAPVGGAVCAAVLDSGSGLATLGQVGPCDDVNNGRNVF